MSTLSVQVLCLHTKPWWLNDQTSNNGCLTILHKSRLFAILKGQSCIDMLTIEIPYNVTFMWVLWNDSYSLRSYVCVGVKLFNFLVCLEGNKYTNGFHDRMTCQWDFVSMHDWYVVFTLSIVINDCGIVINWECHCSCDNYCLAW